MNKQIAFSSGFFVALCIAGISAQAQTSINVSSEVFIDTPALPFAPPPAPVSQIAIAPVIASIPVALPVAAPTTRTWRVESGDVRLSTTLERWAKSSGYNLIWDAQKQVLLSAKDSFDGTLEQALVRVLSSPAIRKSEYPLEACFYPNQPPVIRITRLGEQAEECPK